MRRHKIPSAPAAVLGLGICVALLSACAENRVLLRTHKDIKRAYSKNQESQIVLLKEAATSENRNFSTMSVYYLGEYLVNLRLERTKAVSRKQTLRETTLFLISLYEREKQRDNDFNKKNMLLRAMGRYLNEAVKAHYLKVMREEQAPETLVYLMRSVGGLYRRYDFSEGFFAEFRDECTNFIESENLHLFKAALECIHALSSEKAFATIVQPYLAEISERKEDASPLVFVKKKGLQRSLLLNLLPRKEKFIPLEVEKRGYLLPGEEDLEAAKPLIF